MTKHLGFALFVSLALPACGGSSKTPTGYALVNAPAQAVTGDSVVLSVQQTFSDGTKEALPAGTKVSWNLPTVVALPADSMADSPYPATGASPTAFFLSVPTRPDHATDLDNVLMIRDAGNTAGGSVTLTGTVTGDLAGTVTTTIAVHAMPTGNATNGSTLYGAACAVCHGKTGHGTPMANADGTYTIDNVSYPFPAPGLNAEAGNSGSDPAWNVAVFAQAARADVDDGGVTLREPMPDWLSEPNPLTQQLFTTQDFADIYAFMQTQTM
jgi:mono/diheme cytochrome c family protein